MADAPVGAQALAAGSDRANGKPLEAPVRRFVCETARQLVLLAAPRSGKTRALLARAQQIRGRGGSVVLATPEWTDGLPREIKRQSLSAWCAGAYQRCMTTPRRIIDPEDLRRVFTESVGDRLPGAIAPWFDAYCAMKRARGHRQIEAANAVLVRHGIGIPTDDAAAILCAAADDVDATLLRAEMISAVDLAAAVCASIRQGRGPLTAALDGMTALLIDDAQLLSAAEHDLILQLAHSGIEIAMTVGRWQCFNLRDGGMGLSFLRRLRESDFLILNASEAPGLAPAQASAMMIAGDMARDAPFQATSNHLFRLSYRDHEDEERYLEYLAADIQSAEEVGDGDIAVIVPLPPMAARLCAALESLGVPVALRGRRTLQGSPGFLIANSVVHALRNPNDLTALRQIATLWVDSFEQFEGIARRALETGANLLEVATGSPEAGTLQQMDDWIHAIAAAPPSALPDALRAAPHWSASESLESGLDFWAHCVESADCGNDWWHPDWHPILYASLEAANPPHTVPGKCTIVALQDTVGCSWGMVHLMGFSRRLMPEVCVPAEQFYDPHVLVQVLSRASRSCTLHHIEKLGLGPNGEVVRLKPSPFAVRLGYAEEAAPQQRGPRFTPTPSFRG